MDETKNTIIQRVGEHIDAALGSDPKKVAKQALGERRIQTWMLSAGVSIMSGIAILIITTFAGVPTKLSHVGDEVTTSRNETAAALARIERRIDGGDSKDVEHDSELRALSRRVDRNEYVLFIAPATAPYARAAHIPKQLKPKPMTEQGQAVKPDAR